MASIRSQIIDAVVAALNAPGKPSGLLVARRTKKAAETTQLPKLMVSRVREEITRAVPSRKSPLVERKLTVRLDLWAEGTSEDGAEEAVEPLLIWATSVMEKDQSFGNLAMDTSETTIEWDAELEDLTLGHAWAEFTIRFITKTANQEVKQ
jgi:hypothetical protein